MSDLLTHFEAACEEAGVLPSAALKAGGVHPTLWGKWKGGTSPTLDTFERAREGLQKLVQQRAQDAAA